MAEPGELFGRDVVDHRAVFRQVPELHGGISRARSRARNSGQRRVIVRVEQGGGAERSSRRAARRGCGRRRSDSGRCSSSRRGRRRARRPWPHKVAAVRRVATGFGAGRKVKPDGPIATPIRSRPNCHCGHGARNGRQVQAATCMHCASSPRISGAKLACFLHLPPLDPRPPTTRSRFFPGSTPGNPAGRRPVLNTMEAPVRSLQRVMFSLALGLTALLPRPRRLSSTLSPARASGSTAAWATAASAVRIAAAARAASAAAWRSVEP